MIRIMLMYYVNLYTFLEEPELNQANGRARKFALLNCHCLTRNLTFSMKTTNRLFTGGS